MAHVHLRSATRGRLLRPSVLIASLVVTAPLASMTAPAPQRAAGAPPPATAAAAAAAAGTAHGFGEPIFSTDARGDIVTIGNVATTCDPTYTNDNWSAAASAAACNGALTGATDLARYDGRAMPPINNRLSMVPVDVDQDATTFSSSTARLTLPAGAEVLWAGLHWNGATEVPEAEQLYGSTHREPPPDAGARFRVRLDTPAPGGYATVDASSADGEEHDVWDDTNPGGTVSYGAFADITEAVRTGGTGDYTVADLQTCRGFGGCFGSWSITVVLADATMPPRNLNVWHGWQLTSPSIDGGTQAFTVSGITPPPHGPIDARIGVVQADGDRGSGPDSLDISSPSKPDWKRLATVDRPLSAGEDDWFNSTVNAYGQRRAAGAAKPDLLANLDQDLAMVNDDQTIGNQDGSVSFRVQTAGTESLYSQVVHAAIDLYAPEIAIDKQAVPAGPLAPGDTVTWTLVVRNAGIDPIRAAVVTDPLPEGLSLVPGSIAYVEGGPTAILGPKTDQPGDDAADWDSDTRTLRLRIGDGADATSGGTMAVAPAPDGSDTVTVTYRTTVDAAPDASITNTATADGEGRTLHDPFGPLTTTASDDAEVALGPVADLGITKTDDEAVVAAVGDRFTYRLTVTNAGPSAATGVAIADALDAHLRFVASPDGCTAAGQVVSCPIGALASGDAADRSIEVEVVELPAVGEVIPNVAEVHSTTPDPDCTAATPDAHCNHDDEETPRTPPPDPTPTSTSTTTPAPSSTTTSTAAPSAVTTTRPPSTTTEPRPPATTSARPAAPASGGGVLARTGGAFGLLARAALGLIATGGGLIWLRRRRGAALGR